MTIRLPAGPRRIVVIGAGVIGATVAARAAERGSEVVLLSAEAPGSTAASRASFAWVNAHGKDPESYRRLNEQALRRHIELSGRHPSPWFVATGAEVDGVVHPDEGYVDTRAYLAAQLDALAAAGGSVRAAARAESLDEVRRLYGPLDMIVVAAGAATAALVGGDGHRPVRLRSSSGPDGFLARIRVDDHPVRRVRSAGGLQVRPDGIGVLAAQSLTIEERLRRAGVPASVDTVWPTLRAEIAQRFDWRVPDTAVVRVDHAPRPLAPDGLPVIGAVSEDVYVALTHSGVTLAPLLAELIARDLHGDTDPRLLPFRPERSDAP